MTDKKEPKSDIDFGEELYKAFGQVNDFTLCLKIARRFYEMGRNHQEPVSEDLEEAAVDYGNRSAFTDVDPFNWILEIAFKDGAKWQKQKNRKENSMDYEEIKAQALKDFVEAPQKALLNFMKADQEHRKAFKKILKEKGSVTLDDLRNELNNSLKKK